MNNLKAWKLIYYFDVFLLFCIAKKSRQKTLDCAMKAKIVSHLLYQRQTRYAQTVSLIEDFISDNFLTPSLLRSKCSFT